MMIHLDELDETVTEQIELTERMPDANMVGSYLDNMGLCSDCVHGIAEEYALSAVSHLTAPGAGPDDVLSVFVATFVRGLTVGIMLGRKHPTP